MATDTTVPPRALRRAAASICRRASAPVSSTSPIIRCSTKNVDGLLAALKPLLQQQPADHRRRRRAGVRRLRHAHAQGKRRDERADRSPARQPGRTDCVRARRHARGCRAAHLGNRRAELESRGRPNRIWNIPHIKVGRITADDQKRDGIASDIAAIRQAVFGRRRSSRGGVAERGRRRQTRSAPAALQTVDGLADAVTQNRNALVALTAMRNYDNYTFTHMVNVCILTMGAGASPGHRGTSPPRVRPVRADARHRQGADAAGDSQQARSAHRQEFVIMRRHPVEGAEILRRTPEMPILAPVVAFEHHLRLDGSGYPHVARRSG